MEPSFKDKAKNLFKSSKPIRLMAVGKSGVGKSSIGNSLLTGKRKGRNTPFPVSSKPDSCTQYATWTSNEAEDCFYCDVPGIPDTVPKHTKDFYDVIIKEARKELTAVLFVFKYDRIDTGIYAKAKMLFRELMKSEAIKVLVINDMTDYEEDDDEDLPTEKDYKKLQSQIEKGIGVEFKHAICVRRQTMKKNLDHLRNQLVGHSAHASPDLKTYAQLKEFVAELRRNKNHEEVVYNEAKANINRIKSDIEKTQIAIGTAVAATAAASGLSLLTFGASLGVATATATTGAALAATLEGLKFSLRLAENNISKERLAEASRLLIEAMESFEELEAALK